MCADNTVIYAESKQSAASVKQWKNCRMDGLFMSYIKTVSMFFSIRKNSCYTSDIIVKGERVQEVETVKYLGVVLDKNIKNYSI